MSRMNNNSKKSTKVRGNTASNVIALQSRKLPPANAPFPKGRNSKSSIQQPRARNMITARGNARNQTTTRRRMIIEEDEYIAEVTVANQPNFNNVQYSINPGNATTFPWLSTLAQRFEKYRFQYLQFYYKREVSEFATNGQVGKVMMSFDSDASDPGPSGKQQLEDTEPHVDAMPCENMSFDIPTRELARMTDAFFVRPGGLPGGSDIKTYDVGNLNVATIGIQNNVSVGELHVRYRVELLIPVLESAQAPNNNSVSVYQSTTSEAAGATTVATNLLLASVTTNGLGVVNTSGSFALPVGNYLIDCGVVTHNTGANDSIVLINPTFNGTSLVTGTYPPQNDTYVVGQATWSGYVSCSSLTANALTLPVTVTYTAGTQVNCGWLRIVAI